MKNIMITWVSAAMLVACGTPRPQVSESKPVAKTCDRLVLNLALDTRHLSESNQAELSAFVACLSKRGALKLKISGHVGKVTSEASSGTTVEYAQVVGEAMADSAAKQIVKLGIPRSRLTVLSYGISQPVCEAHTIECARMKHRVEIEVID